MVAILWSQPTMPGIDFQQLRAEISMAEVLELLGFIATNGSGDQRYGPCPLNPTTAKQRDRRFSVNLRSGRFFCRECGRFGDQLDLWAAASKQPLYDAAVDLCNRLHREPPWIQHW